MSRRVVRPRTTSSPARRASRTSRRRSAAFVDESDADELEREDDIQLDDGGLPRDGELQADVIEALRASDVPAGERIRIAVSGRRVQVQGEVETIEALDEILGIVGDVPGVDEVVDEVTVARL